MASIGNLVVRIAGDAAPLARSLSGAKAMLGGFAKGIAGMGRAVSSVGGIIAGGGALAAMIKAVSLAREQEQVTKKLRAVLDATGHSAGFMAEELDDVAGGLQDLTNFGDEAITGIQSLLATFRSIKGDQFTEATKAVLDMNAVLGGSTKAAALQLGKALNDPIRQVGALRKAGVSFTESQQGMIKSLQESGDLIGAQKIVLAELKNEFGGAAEAMADPIVQLKNAFGDLGEVIGESVLPHLQDFARLGKEGVDDMSDSLEDMNGHVDFIADVVHAASIAFKGLVVIVDSLLLGIVLSAKWAAQLGANLANSPMGRDSGLKQWFDDVIANADEEIVRLGGDLNEDIEDFNEKFGALFPSEKRGLGLLDGFKDSAKEAAAAASMLKGEIADALNPGNTFIESLKQQLKELQAIMQGINVDANDLKLMELFDKGSIDQAGFDEARGLIDQIKALQNIKADFGLGAKIADQFRTPLEVFVKTDKDLDRLLDIGAFNIPGGPPPDETFARAFEGAQENLIANIEIDNIQEFRDLAKEVNELLAIGDIDIVTAERVLEAGRKDLADSLSDSLPGSDIFTGRAEEGSVEAARIIAMAQFGGAAVDPQEKMAVDIKAIRADFAALNAAIDKGVEKLDPPETVETPP